MSTIANQLVAVVATLSGFVAHDLLTERSTAPAAAAVPSLAATVDPVTTRAIALEDLAVENWLSTSLRAEREPLRAPGLTLTSATAPAGPGVRLVESRIADVRVNELRFDDPGRSDETAFLR